MMLEKWFKNLPEPICDCCGLSLADNLMIYGDTLVRTFWDKPSETVEQFFTCGKCEQEKVAVEQQPS